ncbi:MAG: UvrD-helicase domain-containing protein [Thermoleophilia bacterium]
MTMPDFKLTPDQRKAATTLAGPLFVAAGAGSGKTGVVTRRFVHAIATGYATVDQILTITFTKKAAAEMMTRIRRDLHERTPVDAPATLEQKERMRAAYREIERAQISTIDSFCASVLRANALAAGIDPNFSAADDSQAGLIREEVFDLCLQELVMEQGEPAVEFITAYDPNRDGTLFTEVTDIYDALRCQGKAVTLPHPAVPDLKAAERELGLAVAIARDACRSIAQPNRNQLNGLNKLADLERALAATDPARRAHHAQMDEIKAGSMGPAKEAFTGLEAPRLRFLNAVLSGLAVNTLDLFRDLLEAFDRRYREEKHRRGVLDFSDLALLTRDLLQGKPDIRERVAARYRLVMVDEFQDTNPLQYEIIQLVARDNLFLVGDENQAIYGFRNADVALFQEQREAARAAGTLIELKDNFRSQPEILDFVDHIFNRDGMLRPGYLELTASAQPDPVREDFRVEVLFVDCCRKSQADGLEKIKTEITRPAEAQMIARRLNQLFDSGYRKGDAAILLRSKNDAEIYRDALTGAGIENYLAIGSSYFGKLEMIDVVNIFRLIINPLDDLALLGALRSPMAGLSDDALFWLRHGGDPDGPGYRGPLWQVLAAPDRLAELTPVDRDRLAGFVTRVEELRTAAGRQTLVNLARRVIDSGDYAATIAAGRNGKQDLANLLKLIDLAGDFELAWGNDLAGFTIFLEHQKEIQAREIEAPTETEGVDAVRIMTMHSAKGLEFPLVVLPNLQADSSQPMKAAVIIDPEGGDAVGLRYRDANGLIGTAFAWDELKEKIADREARELKRLGYVATTRAERHLILSGVAAADRVAGETKPKDPPFLWLRQLLSLRWDRDENLGSENRLPDINGTTVGLSICTDPAAAAAEYFQAGRQLTAQAPEPVNADISRMPDAPTYVPPQISPTSLDNYQKCPRRYFLENVLRVGSMFPRQSHGAKAAPGCALSPAEMGTLIHRIFEIQLPVPGGQPVTRELLARTAAQALPAAPDLLEADYDRAAHLIDNFSRADVAADLVSAAANDKLQRELSFSTMVGRTIVGGQIDALCPAGPAGETTLVVDYKTGSPKEGRTAAEEAASYQYQMTAYALAALGRYERPVRVVLLFLGGREPVQFVQEFTPADRPALTADLMAVIDSMADGTFPPLAAFDVHCCSWCAGAGPDDAGLCPVGSAPPGA